MLLVDGSGNITLVNRQIELLFGYARAELIGKSVDALVPARYRGHHPNLRGSFHAHPTARPMGAGRELFAVRKDGSEMPVEIGLSPLRTAAGPFVLASIVDITERKEAERSLQTSLQEKEILLRELHHRAKNNLQLIASLLDLAQDSPSQDVLAECRDRIHSIALVHEKLYQQGTVATIELEDYLISLSQQVAHAWTQTSVAIEVHAANVSLPLDQAIPCGLVVNELVTNVFKHAFPDGRDGRVQVTARRVSTEELEVSVVDDGVGMPPGEVPRGHIGLELVHALARQLRGRVEFTSTGQGTRAVLTFKG
jgi:PAS domain S-box-containing protein